MTLTIFSRCIETAASSERHRMTRQSFTLLFDSECPFCRMEVQWLQRHDRRGLLHAIDIAAKDFQPGRYGLTKERVHA